MTGRVLGALVLAALTVAGCSAAPREHAPQNGDERLADDVMYALLEDDMRPVVGDFVPERKSVLLSPRKVKQMHDLVRLAGKFLGARELKADDNSTIRYLTASFANGDIALTMTMDGRGKIVHYHLGGALSNP